MKESLCFSNSNHFIFDSIKDKPITLYFFEKIPSIQNFWQIINLFFDYTLKVWLKDLDQN